MIPATLEVSWLCHQMVTIVIMPVGKYVLQGGFTAQILFCITDRVITILLLRTRECNSPGGLFLLIGFKLLAFITITVSFSDDFRYASDTSSAGPGTSGSTSRENVTEGRG